jgi:hypothetical protein
MEYEWNILNFELQQFVRFLGKNKLDVCPSVGVRGML